MDEFSEKHGKNDPLELQKENVTAKNAQKVFHKCGICGICLVFTQEMVKRHIMVHKMSLKEYEDKFFDNDIIYEGLVKFGCNACNFKAFGFNV